MIQVFSQRVRNRELAANKTLVKSRTVEDYAQSIGQTYLAMGAQDPRLNTSGNIDFILQRMLSCYSKEDLHSNRVKPFPVQVIHRIFAIITTLDTYPQNQYLADMICLVFFFFLRPGEYALNPSDSSPFQLQDIQLPIIPGEPTPQPCHCVCARTLLHNLHFDHLP